MFAVSCARLPGPSYSQTQDWALQIRFAQERDSGLYECQLSTHPPSSLFVELVVVGESLSLSFFLAYSSLFYSSTTVYPPSPNPLDAVGYLVFLFGSLLSNAGQKRRVRKDGAAKRKAKEKKEKR